ncbi:MAG: hypothetical protein R3A48_00090 [Polyangiales bacterium]
MTLLRGPVLALTLAAAGCGTPTNSGLGGGALPIDDGGATGGSSCSTFCGAQARAGCTNFSMGSCVSTCQAQLGGLSSCAPAFEAAARCASTATFTCDADGTPDTDMCAAEALAFLTCVRALRDAGG